MSDTDYTIVRYPNTRPQDPEAKVVADAVQERLFVTGRVVVTPVWGEKRLKQQFRKGTWFGNYFMPD